MGLPIRIETRTGDTPTSKRQRQRRDPPQNPADHAGTARAAAGVRRCAVSVRLAQTRHPRRAARAGHLEARRSAVARAGAAVIASRRSSAASGSRRPSPIRRSCAVSWCRQRAEDARADLIVAEGGAAPDVTMLDSRERLPWAGHSARYALARNVRADQGAPHHAGVRQHAQPGGRHLSGSLAHQRRQSGDRAASRLARRGAAAQGRSRDDERPAARGGLHLVARSRHRLGRRRSRHQCRRAEGRVAAPPAHRPRQSPPGRAVEGRAHPGQPLRSAGMPRRARCHRRERAGHASGCASARSTCWRSTCSAAPAARRFDADELYSPR